MNRMRSITIVAGLALVAFPALAQAPSAQQPPASQTTATAVIPPGQQEHCDPLFRAIPRRHQHRPRPVATQAPVQDALHPA